MNNIETLFRSEPGFLKLFRLFKEKYRSLGRIGGTVSLAGFSQAELDSIAGFLAVSPDDLAEKGKVYLTAFEKALKQTAFADYSLIDLIEAVLGEKIITKSEENLQNQKKEADFLAELRRTMPEGDWLWSRIQEKAQDTRWIWNLFYENSHELYKMLKIIYEAFAALPESGRYERLPLFSQRITGNPHFFDQDRTEGKLFLYCLYVHQSLFGENLAGMPKTSEEINELLSTYRLLRDDLWSFVTCRGLLAETIDGPSPVFLAAADTGTVLNVPLKELAKFEKVYPANGRIVWVVENSSVCSALMDEVPNAPIVCTHGQFRTASWLLFDRLTENGCLLYYSGDMDPEGVVMASRFKKRYPNHVRLWHMDAETYLKSLSKESISKRLSKLDALNTAEWAEVIKVMRIHQKAGYQEAIISRLIQDIRKEYNRS